MPKTKRDISTFAKSVYAHLTDLPFTTTAELCSFRGFPSEQQVYRAMRTLEKEGYVSSVRHYAPGVKHYQNRYFVGARGIVDFADIYNTTPEMILTYFPCSSDWQRTLLERIDSVAMVYMLCERLLAVRPSSMPLTIRFPRNSDFDAFATGQDGIAVGFMRMGNTMEHKAFRKRFWAVMSGSGSDNRQRRGPPLTFVLMPTTYNKVWIAEALMEETQRRRRTMSCALATEHEALFMGNDDTPWIKVTPDGSRNSFTELVESIEPDDTYAIEYNNDYKRIHPPKRVAQLKAFELNPNEKRILHCLSDWPMMKRTEIGRMLTGKNTPRIARRVEEAITSLRANNFIEYDTGSQNLILSDAGLRYLSNRDRTRLGHLRQTWGVEGSAMKKLRTERSHTEGINEVVSRIHVENPGRVEALPDHSTAREYQIDRHHKGLVRSDASLLIRLGGTTQTLHLEYEKRGSRGGNPLWEKVRVWMTYYVFEGEQFMGNVTSAENPLNLDDEVTLFAVPTESVRRRMLKLGQDTIKGSSWTQKGGESVPVAITTFSEYARADSILKDKIWLRMDDLHMRPTSPILSEARRAAPSMSRRR